MAIKRLCIFATFFFAPAIAFAQTAASGCMDRLSPVIGVSGQEPNSRTVVPIMTVLRTLGADPVYLDQHEGRDPNDDLPNLHGLIVAGNSGDIDPARYGQALDPRTNLETNPHRADYEFKAVELALTQKLPMLGICGGMQRITTSGPASVRGSLIQHTDGQNQGKMTPSIPPYIATETISIKPDTWLASLINESSTQVNSFHHQAPDRLRKGFRVSALSEHGTIEAMEPDANGPYADQFVIGVMWHPEFSASDLSMQLMKEFVTAAKKRACTVH